jgi:hypothetical protein
MQTRELESRTFSCLGLLECYLPSSGKDWTGLEGWFYSDLTRDGISETLRSAIAAAEPGTDRQVKQLDEKFQQLRPEVLEILRTYLAANPLFAFPSKPYSLSQVVMITLATHSILQRNTMISRA